MMKKQVSVMQLPEQARVLTVAKYSNSTTKMVHVLQIAHEPRQMFGSVGYSSGFQLLMGEWLKSNKQEVWQAKQLGFGML